MMLIILKPNNEVEGARLFYTDHIAFNSNNIEFKDEQGIFQSIATNKISVIRST